MAPKRRAKRQKPPPEPPEPPELIDFRAAQDDAWYSVAVEMEGEVLRVMYRDFSSVFDERFDADSFISERELEEFGNRFRRTSIQLQDSECREVVEGTEVVVSYAFGAKDVRFYDAVVDSVIATEHPPTEGQCSCTFVICWQHGPLVGKTTSVGIDNMCRRQPKHLKIDPVVETFLDTARQRIEARHSQANQADKDCDSRRGKKSRCSFIDLETNLADKDCDSHRGEKPRCSPIDLIDLETNEADKDCDSQWGKKPRCSPIDLETNQAEKDCDSHRGKKPRCSPIDLIDLETNQADKDCDCQWGKKPRCSPIDLETTQADKYCDSQQWEKSRCSPINIETNQVDQYSDSHGGKKPRYSPINLEGVQVQPTKESADTRLAPRGRSSNRKVGQDSDLGGELSYKRRW